MSTSSTSSTSSTGQPTIRFSGLGTGIDTNSIVEQLMSLERAPIDRINKQKQDVTTQQGVVQEINGLLGTLRDAAAAMYAPDALSAKTASTGDPSMLSASADPTAAAGTYNVTVTSLAQAQTLASKASPTITAGTSLTLKVGTADAIKVDVAAGDDLQKVADKINGTDGTGVAASVINSKLVLISKTSGTGGQITVGGDAAAGFGFTETQPATDAGATVNGLPVTSSGNTIQGAIAGVTLNLTKLGSTTVTVGADTTQNVNKAKAFVDAYNAVVSNIRAATAYDPATKTAGTLQGDQTMSSLMGQLRGIAGSAVQGTTGAYTTLASLGITSARDGTMTLDQNAFNTAMAADPDAVKKVFAKDDGVTGSSGADGIARQIQAFANTFSSDILSARLTGFTSSLKRMDDRIADLEQVMTIKEQTLRNQFSNMETMVSQFQSQGADLASQIAKL